MKSISEIKKSYFEHLKQEELNELENYSNSINSFISFASKLDVKLNKEDFSYCQTVGIIATYPNIVPKLHISLIPDKEGLYNFNDLTKNFEKRTFAKGYLFFENFVLMASPYFRRSYYFQNGFEPRFIEKFWDLDIPESNYFIALDLDRVRINIDNKMILEYDTWYGANFHKEIENIPDGNVKLKPPTELDEFDNSIFFSDSFSLDIKWATSKNIKTFQAEEFKTDKIKIHKNKKDYFPVKYIHAEYDLTKKHFRHFDGAIHYYTEEEYYRRRESDFNYNNKSSTHIKTYSEKLFKINGKIPINTWIEFSSHFFSKNPLVIEYFEGKYPAHIIELLERIRIIAQNE